MKARRLFTWLLTGAAFAATQTSTTDGTAGTDCRIPNSGYLCFLDHATWNWGRVSGDNPVWAYLPGGWDNRADYFGNFGRTHSVCVFHDTYYGHTLISLLRGVGVTGPGLYNVASSNDWVLDWLSC